MILKTFLLKSHKVAYLDEGAGEPLVMLHNGGTDHSIWRHQIEAFRGTRRVIAVDLLGCGASDRPDFPYTLGIYVEMIAALHRHLGSPKMSLMGNCIGAASALEYARLFPGHVSELALFNVYGGSAMIRSMKLIEWGLVTPSFAAKILSSPLAGSASVLWGNPPSEEDPFLRRYSDVIEAHPGLLQYRKNMVAGAPSFNKFGSPLELPNGFPRTALFWGQKNRVLDFTYGESMRSWLRPELFVAVKESGHLAMYECPLEVNRELGRFLSAP